VTPRQRRLGSHRTMPPPRPGLATANRKTTRDASDRLLQSTFQRRAPVLREKTSSLAGHKALWSPVGFASHALHPLRPTASSPRRAFSSRPDLRGGWTSDTPVTARHPTTLLATPFARRPRPPSPSLREERWLQTTQGVFRRRGALPRPSPVPRCCHPDLAVDVPSPHGVSSAGLGPVRPPQPQPQVAFLDPTPLDDFCFQHEKHGHANERLFPARTAISRCPLPRATEADSAASGTASGLTPCGTRRRPTVPARRPRASLRAAA
jgi:hypothetical protein